MSRGRLTVGALVAALTVTLGACGLADDYNDDRGRGDAPVGEKNDDPKDVINFPDEFSNVAHACDGHGHRVFVTTQNADGKFIAVINDPSCGE